MRQFCKRGFSFLMSLCMLFTLVPAGAAETGTAYDAGESCFDFEAANYSVKENEGEISVKILRQGDANAPVNVAVKAADFLAEYGRDYEILLDGEALSAQKGEIVDPSMFTFDPGQPVGETGESATEATQPAAETGEPVAETVQPATETAEAVTETEEPAAETEEAATETEEPVTETAEASTKVEEPATETEEPAAETGEAATETAEASTETAQPAAETGEPVAETAQPATETAEAVTETEEPAAETEEAATETEEPVTETAEASTKVEEPATETEEPAAETGEAVTETAETSTETAQPAAETGEAATETEEAVEDTAEAVEEVSLSNDAALAGVQFFETPAVSFETPSVSFDVPTPEGVTEPEAATDAAESVADTGAATDTAEPVTDTESVTDAAEPVTDTESVTDAAEPVADTESATDAAETSTEAETPSKVDRKSNSPLLDAQAAYLGVPEDDDNQQMQDALERITKDLHTFFEEAQGAQGIVYFAPGVTERVLTVRVIDNDDADGPRMFLMSLLGTDSEKAAVALNNTVKVTIEDDEAYEPSTFSLYAKDRTLTVDKPTATVKVSRTGGLQYFATAYVSTVTETALSTAYEKMNYREVGFIPGQTEVEVTVTAKEFDGGTFGVRLETNEGDFTREHYLKFTIEAQDATPIGDAPDEDAAELMAGGVTLGAASYFYGDDISTNSLNSFQNFPGGWKSTRSGNAGASVRGGYDSLQRRNYALLDAWADDKGAYGMIVSNQKWNFTGVKNLSFQMSVSGDNWRSGKWSMFGAASNQKWSDYDKAYTEIGDMGITTETVSGVASLKGEHYLKFGTEATLGGKNNPRARLYWFKLDYAKYSFDLQDSPRMFERILYDFSQGTPQISGVYYDGTSQTTMTPGAVKIEARNGNRTQDVGAFYTNAEKAVTITAADGVAQHGFILAGVYFVSDDRSASSMWDGRQYTNRGNYYYVDADSNGKINLTLGASFVETLISKGVLHSEQRDETIRVFPKYEQETAKVHFENTDRPTDSAGNDTGLYDAAHLASHFANIIETYNLDARGQQEDKPYWSGLSQATYTPRDKPPMTYYETTVAKNSVIRVKSVPLGSRTAQGAYWWYFGKENQRTKTYHKAGDRIASANYTGGQPVSETDYTMADIVVTGDLCIKPATNVQTFRVRMFPGARTPETMPSLQNAVVDVSTASADMDVGVNVTNAEGVMDLADPYLGKVYTLQANPPQGYYTFWTRMTGDADEDGTITDAERETLGNVNAKSSNPDYIWGNTATIKLDQNDTRYYYEFLPAVSGNSGRNATGKVIRQNNTLRGLVAREPDFAEPTPIANAYVSAAGQNGRTDADGKYAIPLPGAMPSSGNVSMTLSRDGRTYHSQTRIQASTLFKIPALEEFEPKEVSASYENKGPVSGGGINCEDENVSITVAVTSTGTVIPTKAFFSLYNQQGAERFKLNWYETSATTDQETEPREVFRDGYSVEYRTERVREKTTLYATITFNPRRDTSSGNQIYVTFADQSGVQYSPINVGYTFYTPLTLGEFIFGMIGSPTLENVVTNSGVLDLIGDPLGNTDLGAVTGFASTSYEHYPPNVARENQENSKIQMTSNTFGWASEFSSTGGFDLNKEINENGGSFDSFMDGLDGKNASSAGGFSASGSYGFSITPEIGFRLTTSQRNITEQGNTVTKHCFEDLVFYVKLGFDVSAEATITTPIYVEVLVGGRLSGSMAGIYHMFMQYPDLAEQQGVLPFDSENFGLFKSFPNNPVQREGYIFIDPQLDLKLGVGGCSCYIYGTAIFKFDIDFQFTSARINAYADLAYRMNFGIEAFGIEVYEYETPEILRFKIFNTEGTNAHINFGYEVAQTLNAQLMSAADDDITQTRPVERSYLANRTGWQVSDAVTLLDAEGSVEKELRGGSSDNMQVQMVPINDNDDLLMVFVDDAPARSTGNKRAVYYSVYSASRDSWSTPAIIHDDGTPDDYPTLQNLGDGKILAAWSSAERVMPDDANLETMASAMNIEVAFFDASSRTFGESAVLTKTTEGDFTADIMPRAAYDPATDRIILYYTKTEYSDLKVLSDYGKAESVVAYLFYENGAWSNVGDTYTAEELEGMTPEEVAAYKSNWYGQRFLEPRLNLNASQRPRIVDTAAIGYNGLALFAYTVDWDNSLNTSNDRDVLLQIYNFSENSFTHIIRVTKETGAYTLPKLAHSDNRTYLFYGDKPQDEGEDHGAIRALDVSDILHNELYERVTDGGNAYYVLRRTTGPVTDPDSGAVMEESQTVDIVADIVTECDTLTDYGAFVADDGRMYLVWTDCRVEGEGRNIYASLLNTGDNTLGGQAGTYEREGQRWSAPVALTDGGEDTRFSGLGTASVGNSILLVSAKGSYSDPSRNSMTQIKHTPFSNLIPDGDLTFDNPYAVAGNNVQVTATLKNPGLETFVPGENGVRVTFQANGANAAEEVYYGSIPGGSSIEVTTNIEVPEGNAVTVSASCNGESVSTSLERGARMRLTDESIERTIVDERTQTEGFRYVATLSNDGNEPSNVVRLTVKSGETVLGEFQADAVQPGEVVPVEIVLDIPESAWNINDEGVGTLTADISARNGSKNFWSGNQDLTRYFDAEAIALMGQVRSVRNESFSIQTGELALLIPEIQGIDDESATVEWLSSDNEAIASIDRSNMISGVSPGTTTLHGMVVPSTNVISLNANGESVTEDWSDKIPESLQKPVTAQVTVLPSGDDESGYTVAFNSDGGSSVDSVTVEENGVVTEPTAPTKTGYTFDGWYLNGQPYNFSTPVAGNITLQARWKEQSSMGGTGAKAGCYVATSVYGSYDCPEVWTLRRFRDEVLADTWYGRLFIRAYYAVSPTAVKLFGDCAWFQSFWRERLDKMVDNLQSDGFASTPYEDIQW